MQDRGFVEVSAILSEETAKRFPDSRLTSIGGFFFLRFFCPAIVSPESFELAVASTYF
jgi:neurofibromin 1